MTTLKELADLVGGDIVGDPGIEISGVAEIQNAFPGTISFVSIPKYKKYLKTTEASAVVVARDEDVGGLNAIRVDNPALSFSRILDHFATYLPKIRGIHTTAVVGQNVVMGENVAIGPYVVIEDGVRLGDDVVVGPQSVIGHGSTIGNNAELHYHVIVYHRCVLGRNVVVHSGTVIGSDGFGFVTDRGIHHRIPQIGGVIVGNGVEIGANCAIDRGTMGDTVIGEGSKLDNLVHIAHNVKLGKGCLVTAQVAIAGSTRIGDYVAFGGQSGVADHLNVGSHARLAARTGVTRSIRGDKTYAGMPVREIREKNKLDVLIGRLPELAKRISVLESQISGLEGKR